MLNLKDAFKALSFEDKTKHNFTVVVWGVVVGFDHEDGTHEIAFARANLTEDEAPAVLDNAVKRLLEKGVPTDKIHWKICRHRVKE